MRTKGVVVLRVLAIVVAAVLAAGCSAEVRRLQGQNQQLINERESFSNQIDDLKALLAQSDQQIAQLNADLQKAQVDVDYWMGQAEAYKDALDKRAGMGDLTLSENLMRQLAADIGAEYLPGGGIRLASDLLFDSGKTDLKASARDNLKTVAAALASKDAMGLHLRVDGHTDGQPIKYSKWKDNMELSQARSRAVWLELKADGVSPERMFTAGFGEFVPIDTNSTAAGRAVNRRVELWLVVPTGASAGSGASSEAAPAAMELPEPTK